MTDDVTHRCKIRKIWKRITLFVCVIASSLGLETLADPAKVQIRLTTPEERAFFRDFEKTQIWDDFQNAVSTDPQSIIYDWSARLQKGPFSAV